MHYSAMTDTNWQPLLIICLKVCQVMYIHLHDLVRCLPLIFLMTLIGFTDGRIQWQIRRWRVARENSVRYHRWLTYRRAVLRLTLLSLLICPASWLRDWLLLVSSFMLALTIKCSQQYFKKYS